MRMQTIATIALLLAGSCYADTFSEAKESHGRGLRQVYEGCSQGSWGSVCTTDNKDGTSTICTETPYYSGCNTYPNGDLPPVPPGSPVPAPPTGRKLLAGNEEDRFENIKGSHGRDLKVYEGCSAGSWGSVCTTDNKDGTSTICTNTPYYSGCQTYPNGSLPRVPQGSPVPAPPPPATGRKL